MIYQMASIGWALLLFLAQLNSLAASSAHAYDTLSHHSSSSLCHQDQANDLLKLKQSFFFYSSSTTLASWQSGTDCCLWEGVGCLNSSGHVIALDLSGFGLYSQGIDPVLFNLTSLRLLDLSMNDFGGQDCRIPSVGFERLSLLTHLNLSNSGVKGQVPIGISKLMNLVSLDLSSHFIDTDYLDTASSMRNNLWAPYFPTLVANLTNLRELYLDHVILFSSPAEDCFKALAKSVPQLQVLSLEECWLQGYIDPSLSRLYSLVVINLSHNDGMTPGPFPEFFMNFLNLSVLQLAAINLEGWFPDRIFQSQRLKVLDLSKNLILSGHVPNFANATSLETLRLDLTNFSYVKPSSFSSFKSLMELGLDRNLISTNSLSSFGTVASLRKLVLTRLGLLRELESFFSWMQDVKNLISLEVSKCDFSTRVPSSTRKSKNLRSLVMSDCNLTTQTLPDVANLINPQSFVMFRCDISGQLPSAIGNMSNLERLEIFFCQISGPIPHEVGALKGLTSLKLVHSGLFGRIPSSIVNLTRLIQLDLSVNYLSGGIPTLFTLPALQYLNFSSNQLSGPIKEFDAVSSHLMLVDLSMNGLTGQIPESFFVLTSLKALVIGGNILMGSVDLTSFWRLENLTYLDLSNNKLIVTDGGGNPSSPYLPELSRLELSNCNMIKLPNVLTRLKHITYLDLSCNEITGYIPEWIWEAWNSSLTHLNLSHNRFIGMQLTSYVIPLDSHLETLDLSSNRLQGQIPMPSSSPEFLDYSNNAFSSLLPNFTLYLSNTLYLSLSNNNISGHLPDSICDSPLEILDLSFNNFRGPIPPCLLENGFLNVLNLNENQFEGALLSNISSGCSLQFIDLHGNKIDGQLPRALSNCTDLEVLDLGSNQIADTFPSWLGTLLNLRVLILRSNQFHGPIGYPKYEQSGEHFSSLQIIDLASNNFSGNLDPQLFESLKSMEKYNNTGQIIDRQNLTVSRFYQDAIVISYKGSFKTFGRVPTTFTSIDLSDNALEGSIPESIGRLASLISLNMSHNAFGGAIPRQLGGMTALESVDLSSNRLSGEIPEDLTNLTFLSFLNLSNNRLEGRIPQARQFATFDSSSFDGNAELCGPPLSKQCGTSDTPSESHPKSSSVFLLDKERTLIMSILFCFSSLVWALELDFQRQLLDFQQQFW